MRTKRNFLLIFTLVSFTFACSTLTGNNPNSNSQPVIGSEDAQPSPPTATATATAVAVVAPVVPSLGESDSAGEEFITEDLPPLSFEDLYQAGLDTGDWDEGQGLVLFMRYFVGEISGDQIPGVGDVVEKAGTGITHLVNDYLALPDVDEVVTSELERLLRVFFPPQEVLESISTRAGFSTYAKLAALRPAANPQNQQACMDFAGTGYEGNIDFGVTCYYYEEINFDGRIFRVYFPEWWVGDEEKQTLIGNTMDALGDAATTYLGYSDLIIQNVNLVFAILPNGTTNGAQYYFDITEEACPITMFPQASASYGVDQYKQIVAHEMFHCVQDWSFPNTSPYGTHKWWLEGTAHYFSNLVYPSTNREWNALGAFDLYSRNTPIFFMTYENFTFFQFMGNKYSTAVLIDILMRVSAAGGQAGQESALRGVTGMDENFNLFVVEYLSSGILDSGGGRIFSSPTAVTDTRRITEKGEVKFDVQPFVAMRYGVYFEKEKRFLQNALNPDGTQFSSVESKLRRNIDAWSDLPPEIRSECKKDVVYIFVPTTVKDGYTSWDMDVTLVEKAECDPCLLGTWDIVPESYEAFMERIMAEADTGGMAIDLSISGHQYIQFVEDGKVYSQREDFTIGINNQLDTIINGFGSGNYTANGEKMTVSNFMDVTESVALSVGNGLITYASESATFSFFGTDYSDPNLSIDLNEGNAPQTKTVDYVCKQDNLTITLPDYGDVDFIRVEKILPTPVPTPGAPDNPNP